MVWALLSKIKQFYSGSDNGFKYCHLTLAILLNIHDFKSSRRIKVSI